MSPPWPRVPPWGDLHAVPSRGLFTGNRGCLVDDAGLQGLANLVAEVLGLSSLDAVAIDSEHAPFGRVEADGCIAAFRAADLGLKVTLVERGPSLGGVCLNVGCIPSKALLHTAEIINEAAEMADHGIDFGKPKIDIKKLAGFKNKVIKQLTGGLAGLAKQRKVEIVTGYGKFTSPNSIEVTGKDGSKTVSFDNAIIAAGSSVFKIPGFPYEDERLMDSTGALELAELASSRLPADAVGIQQVAGLYTRCRYSPHPPEISELQKAVTDFRPKKTSR